MQFIRRASLPTAALLCALALAPVAGAATQAAVPQGQSWDEIKQLPDWSGVWQATSFKKHFIASGTAPYRDLNPPFTPKAAARFAELKAITLSHGDFPTRSDHCISLGVPGDMDHPQTRGQFLFTPGQVTFAASEFVRRIHTDGRPHNEDIITFQGDSIGHWEAGGVLVVDTTALDPGNEFVLGLQQGENAHVVERFHLENKTLLIDDVTVTAPEVLAQPWRYRITFERDPHPLFEFDCAQANHDVDPVTGKQGFDLALPPK